MLRFKDSQGQSGTTLMLPIFYINLDKRPDRDVGINEQLAKLQLSACRVSALDGKNLTHADREFVDEDNFILTMKRPIRHGEIGCAASHRYIWKKMVDESISFALILEDDVMLDSQLLTILQNPQFYEQFDFINLSSNSPYKLDIKDVNQLLQNNASITRRIGNDNSWKKLDWRSKWKIYQLDKLSKDIIVCSSSLAPALTSGYIVSNKAVKSFLQASSNLHFPIDYVWRYSGGFLKQGFLLNPLIVQREEIASDISGRNETYKLSFKQKLQRMRLKRQKNIRLEEVKQMYDV